MDNLFQKLTMVCQVPLARNKLPTLRPNSYLHTQISEIHVTTKSSKQLHIICSVVTNGLTLHCRDIEGQQQKLVSEHDAHKREEPDFPELVNVVNRY